MTCIVVDDEPIAREGMGALIEKKTSLLLKGKFRNTAEAAAYLEQHETDLVFLDIEMPGVNGLEFSRVLSPKTLVIFTTAYVQYALESYEVDAIDYLVKPIHEHRFLKAVNKAIQFNAYLSDEFEKNQYERTEDEHIFVRADRQLHKVAFRDLLYIEGMKDYVIFNLKDRRLITAMNVKTAMTKLPPGVFKRIGKSHIVNIRHVTSIGNHSVFLNNIELPLGMIYREGFLNDFVNGPK